MDLDRLATRVLNKENVEVNVQMHYLDRVIEKYSAGIKCDDLGQFLEYAKLTKSRVAEDDQLLRKLFDLLLILCNPLVEDKSFDISANLYNIEENLYFLFNQMRENNDKESKIVAAKCIQMMTINVERNMSPGNFFKFSSVLTRRKFINIYCSAVRDEVKKAFSFDDNDNGFISAREYAEANDVDLEEIKNSGIVPPIYLLKLLRLGHEFLDHKHTANEVFPLMTSNGVVTKILLLVSSLVLILDLLKTFSESSGSGR